MFSIHPNFILLAAMVTLIITIVLILLSKKKEKQGEEEIADTMNRIMIVFAAGTFLSLLIWVGVQ